MQAALPMVNPFPINAPVSASNANRLMPPARPVPAMNATPFRLPADRKPPVASLRFSAVVFDARSD